MCFGVFSAKVYKMARLLATVVCVVLLVSAVLAKHDPLYEARSGTPVHSIYVSRALTTVCVCDQGPATGSWPRPGTTTTMVTPSTRP
jgi:hypothetical protein